MDAENSSNRLDLLLSPREYFQDMVRQGMSQCRVQTLPMAESYLVSLLEEYLDARRLHGSAYVMETGQKEPETLAEAFLLAQNTATLEKYSMLRRLGDKALYISGFFGDSLSRKIVDIDYYADIGGAAYASLAQYTKEAMMAKVYESFSRQFLEFVDVLSYVSQNSFIKSDESILRLYEKYMKTGSRLAREKLVEMGVTILPEYQVKLGKQG